MCAAPPPPKKNPPPPRPAGVGVSENPGQLYNSMHSYLAASAIDGVKVDCQVGVWGGLGGGLWGERLNL